MNFTALIFAIMLILGVCNYEHKADIAAENSTQLLIGWDEDSATPISGKNPHRVAVLELISAMDDMEQVERFDGAELPSGYVINSNGETIEFGAYDEDTLLSIPAVEGYEYEPGRTALYIKDKRGLRLYDWEYYLELDMLSRNAQYKELVDKTFVGRIKSDDPYHGIGYCLLSEEYGEVCVTLIEPVFATEGELMEVTILPQEEPLTRMAPIYALGEKLYEE